MTTVVAIRKGQRLCIASDTLALFGSRKETAQKHVYDNGKIIQIGPNFVGMTGHSSWELILKHYFFKKNSIQEWQTVDQIFEIFSVLHRHLKEIYFLHLSYSRYEPLESSNFGILIMNRYGIFEIDYLKVVRQHSRFSAIGTGEEYALGAIEALYNKTEDPEELAKIGIEAAAQFDRKTGLPLITHCIDLEQLDFAKF